MKRHTKSQLTGSAATTAKRRWVVEHYDALLPDGQAAVDLALVALPRRPISKRSPASERQAALPAARSRR